MQTSRFKKKIIRHTIFVSESNFKNILIKNSIDKYTIILVKCFYKLFVAINIKLKINNRNSLIPIKIS